MSLERPASAGSRERFLEQPDTVRVMRDPSTVEELELMLAMSRYALHLFDAPERFTQDQIAPLMEAHGKQLRSTFIATHGYRPEDSRHPAMQLRPRPTKL